MVGQGGPDHARHRTLSVPAGPAVALDREPRDDYTNQFPADTGVNFLSLGATSERVK